MTESHFAGLDEELWDVFTRQIHEDLTLLL